MPINAKILPVQEATFDFEIPLVIIGGGAAGMTAALAAADEGCEALVLERDAIPTGSTALSAGLIPASSTRWQREAGIDDDASRLAADIMKKAKGEPDAEFVRRVAEQAGPALEWLSDRHGLPFSVITNFRYPGHSTDRMHGLPSRSGSELIDRLQTAVEAAGVHILCEAHVDTLFVDGEGDRQTIAGLSFTRPDGSREQVGCKALILACCGYGGNKELVARHIPQLAEALYFGHPGNDGAALLWGQQLGAATKHLPGHQGHGSVAHPAGILITWAAMTEGGVQVNTDGKRFSNETLGYSEQATEVLRQPGRVAWAIFDDRIAGICRQFEDFRQAESIGAVLSAGTIADLAIRTKLPVATLAATLAEVEALKDRGGADAFGRDFKNVHSLTPPYYAARVTGALFHTQGGLVVDADARVIREDGSAISNLFAAGGAAVGVSGSTAAGYLAGNGLLTAIVLGRLAGENGALTASPEV